MRRSRRRRDLGDDLSCFPPAPDPASGSASCHRPRPTRSRRSAAPRTVRVSWVDRLAERRPHRLVRHPHASTARSTTSRPMCRRSIDRADWEFSEPRFLPFVSASIRTERRPAGRLGFTTLQRHRGAGMSCGDAEPARGGERDAPSTASSPSGCPTSASAVSYARYPSSSSTRPATSRSGTGVEPVPPGGGSAHSSRSPGSTSTSATASTRSTTLGQYLQNFALDVNGSEHPLINDYGDPAGCVQRATASSRATGTIEASLGRRRTASASRCGSSTGATAARRGRVRGRDRRQRARLRDDDDPDRATCDSTDGVSWIDAVHEQQPGAHLGERRLTRLTYRRGMTVVVAGYARTPFTKFTGQLATESSSKLGRTPSRRRSPAPG